MINVRCVEDNCEMVPHDNNIFICLKCEKRVQVATELARYNDIHIQGAQEYNDV